MERRGGCCIAMYGGGDAEAAWKVGRIMLRFRPIAPKPAAGSSALPAAEAVAPAPRRPKRRGPSNAAGRPRGRRRRKIEAAEPSLPEDDDETLSTANIVTLPLMPETPQSKDEPVEAPKESPPRSDHSHPSPPPTVPAEMGRVAGAVAAPAAPRPRAVESWVTVECVTDTWREGEVAWRSDEAVRAALAADECPGFVSDRWGQVAWSNEAYRRMVGAAVEGAGCGGGGGGCGAGAEEEEEVQAILVAPRGLVTEACRAFTCSVRVRYARLPRGAKRSVAAPCDVWRLDRGGWAWRLDVKAALGLAL